jgi:hypothetical protein
MSSLSCNKKTNLLALITISGLILLSFGEFIVEEIYGQERKLIWLDAINYESFDEVEGDTGEGNADVEMASDLNPRDHVKRFESGEELKYKIDVPEDGDYQFFVEGATTTAGTELILTLSGKNYEDYELDLLKTSGWNKYKFNFGPVMNLDAGEHELALENVSKESKVRTGKAPKPYFSNIASVGLAKVDRIEEDNDGRMVIVIQAEDFNSMSGESTKKNRGGVFKDSEGVDICDNEGKAVVLCFIDEEEEYTYKNIMIPETGEYRLVLLHASDGNGGSAVVTIDGDDFKLESESTSWTDYVETVGSPLIPLKEGKIKKLILSEIKDLDIDYMMLILDDSTIEEDDSTSTGGEQDGASTATTGDEKDDGSSTTGVEEDDDTLVDEEDDVPVDEEGGTDNPVEEEGPILPAIRNLRAASLF